MSRILGRRLFRDHVLGKSEDEHALLKKLYNNMLEVTDLDRFTF